MTNLGLQFDRRQRKNELRLRITTKFDLKNIVPTFKFRFVLLSVGEDF